MTRGSLRARCDYRVRVIWGEVDLRRDFAFTEAIKNQLQIFDGPERSGYHVKRGWVLVTPGELRVVNCGGTHSVRLEELCLLVQFGEPLGVAMKLFDRFSNYL